MFWRVFAFHLAISDANAYHILQYFHKKWARDNKINTKRDFRRRLALQLMKTALTPTYNPSSDGAPEAAHALMVNPAKRIKNGMPTMYAAQIRCACCSEKCPPRITRTINWCSCMPRRGLCKPCYERHIASIVPVSN